MDLEKSDLYKLAMEYNLGADIKNSIQLDRLDIICGFGGAPPVFPCEKCHKESCAGKGKCKGFGAYALGVRIQS